MIACMPQTSSRRNRARDGERDDVVLLREQCVFGPAFAFNGESFESISRNNQRPSTSPVRLVRSTSGLAQQSIFLRHHKKKEKNFFGDMEERFTPE